jgi:DNA-binding MarR family transcriptional regulator
VDYIETLGPLAFASRLKRLSYRLLRNVSQIYREQGFDFDDRWFTVYHLLYHRSPMPVTEIAKELRLTHPAVVQVAEALIDRGLVTEERDEADLRVRYLVLTPKGRRLARRLEPIWKAVEDATASVLKKTDRDFLKSVRQIEQALDKEEMYSRVSRLLNRRLQKPKR